MEARFLLTSLKELSLFDAAITHLKSDISLAKQALEKLSQRLEEAQATVTKRTAALDAISVRVKKHELDLKEIESHLAAKRDQLAHVADERQLLAVHNEITLLEKQKNDSDMVLLDEWHKKEQQAQKLETATAHHADLAATCAQRTAELHEKIALLKQRLEQAERRRTKHLLTVPEEWRQRYEQMRTKVLDPVAALDGEACGSCFQSVLPQDYQRLKMGAVLTCKGCFRMLYKDVEEA